MGLIKTKIAWNKGLKGEDFKKHFPNGMGGLFVKGGIAPMKGRQRLDVKGKKRFTPWMLGENNPKWIKDRTRIKKYWTERNNPEYKQWRNRVCKRDGFVCKISNQDCDGKIIAHHILPWRDFIELRYEINNGITLCKYHHPRRREDEEKMVITFQQLISH